MTPQPWRVEADRLRAEGLTITEIAGRVGICRSYVGEHLTPHRCACGNRRSHQSARCGECEAVRRRTRREQKARVIERLWAEGATGADIAAALGTTTKTIGHEIHRLRTEGLVDIPFRRPDLAVAR